MKCQHCFLQAKMPVTRLRQDPVTPWADANHGILFRGYYWCRSHRRLWVIDSQRMDNEAKAMDLNCKLNQETDRLYLAYLGGKRYFMSPAPTPEWRHL